MKLTNKENEFEFYGERKENITMLQNMKIVLTKLEFDHLLVIFNRKNFGNKRKIKPAQTKAVT